MRKPRDIDAELRALAEKAKSLKARRLVQLGELVVATGADRLDPDILAGALISASETRSAEALAEFGRKGAVFNESHGGGRRPRPGAASDGQGRAPNASGATPD